MSRRLYKLMADKGLTLSQANSLADAVLQTKSSRKIAFFDAAKLISALGPYAFLAAAAPPAVGYYAGRGLAKMTDVNPSDVSQVHTDEIIAELRANIEALKTKRDLKEGKHK